MAEKPTAPWGIRIVGTSEYTLENNVFSGFAVNSIQEEMP